MAGLGARRWIGAARGLTLGLVLGTAGLAAAADAPGGMALESECVLELRGGTTIRAQVLEYLPGSHVMLRAFDGQTFRLPIEEVLDIRHPGDGPFPPSPACERIARAVMRQGSGTSASPLAPAGSERPAVPPAPAADEPASRNVRPPVAPPAAAVANGPPVTLETPVPGLELQFADGMKSRQSYSRRRQPLVTWEYTWKKICDAPCGQPIGEEGVYRVAGAGVRPTAPFRLDVLGDGPFHLKLRMGPAGMYRTGIGGIVLGVLSGLGGAALLIVGGVNSPQVPVAGAPASYRSDYESALGTQQTMFAAGGVLIGTGLIETVVGALLMRRGKSLVTVERPRRPVEPSAD